MGFITQLNDNYIPISDTSYEMCFYKNYDFNKLKSIRHLKKAGKGKGTYNNAIIMLDTETSKKHKNEITQVKKRGNLIDKYVPVVNYVCAWTISIRAEHKNICTLWGTTPSQITECLTKMRKVMGGDEIYIFVHNWAYDYVFLRQFLFRAFGSPISALATKPHYPVYHKFKNGLVFKDSLILAQRKLEKWADDLDVEHKKAVGKWEYNKIRTQHEKYNDDELEYIEHDTLAGVECIDATITALHKHLYSLPLTATGIPREHVRKIADKDLFLRVVDDAHVQKMLEMLYHGGYTHGNRFYINTMVKGKIQCFDFTSSYPFVMLSEKYPMEKFTKCKNLKPKTILKNNDEYAFIFKLILYKAELKDDKIPMPALQYSKCTKIINPCMDNGRVLACDYAEIYLNDVDLEVILSQYKTQGQACVECYYSKKDYLPRWFTDYVFQCYVDKCKYKGGDPVLYSIAKAKLNSLYGLICQKPVREEITENYTTGEYETVEMEHDDFFNYDFPVDFETKYNKWVKKRGSVLPYKWGCYVTSYAYRNLFKLGACAHITDDGYSSWIYSDTDSCYVFDWDYKKIEKYNKECKRKLKANNYGACIMNGNEYWLGVAVSEGDKDIYTEFKTLGAKKYAGRCKKDNEIHITVAGVPKKGAECLHDDLSNFIPNTIFDGLTTGKLTHTYLYNDITVDEDGVEYGDCVDLTPCDYKLDTCYTEDFDLFEFSDIEVQVYDA